ncbi:HlyC/CorC family transporter [Candidatus Pacearchaeota archaeon]|nr:HlyC/CorC family transporter [Candidatus Pacearchaeota archaeon]
MLEIQIISLVILLILSALFSGTETALMSINQIKTKALVKQGKKGAATLHRIKQNPHRLIITILIGNNLVNIGAASLATVMFTGLFGSSGVGMATGIMTFLILIFGEITPKTYAANNAERISLAIARPVEILSIFLHPLVWMFEKISKIMSKLLGSKKEGGLSESELETIVTMGRKEGLLEKEAAEIMHNVLKFGGTIAQEIMTPRIDMKMIDGEKKISEVLDFIVKTPYSRYPVYIKENEIEGIIDIDDVLRQVRDKKLSRKVKTILRPVLFIPETKEIDDLLTEFEGKEVPMAIVVDEYSDIEGLVTVEDILEEIVGDIFDKSKRKNLYVKKLKDDVIRVDAKIPIDDLNKVLKLGIKGEQYNTLAGYIEHKLQRIPRSGEKIKLRNATIQIDKATNQGIKSVKIIKGN